MLKTYDPGVKTLLVFSMHGGLMTGWGQCIYTGWTIKEDPDMPPLIVHYVDGSFELNDGNHRHKAYENLGIEKAWVR